ncbi:MAG: transporter [Methylomonas sp.]
MYRKALPLVLASLPSIALADHGSLGFGVGTASPIVTQTGITLPTGMWAGGVITQFINFKSTSDQQLLDAQQAHGDVHSVYTFLQPSLFAAYGVTDDLTLGLRLPYVLRSGVHSPSGEPGDPDNSINHLGDPSGFGDVSLFGQYRFFHTADNLNHLSFVAGLKTPTGATGVKTNQGDLFEVHHQPGSGSWDPSFGFSFTRAMGQFSFDSSVLYTVATQGAQETNLGDVFDYNIAISYAFGAPARNALFAESNNAPWTAVLELNGTRREHQKTAGIVDPNSGGDTVYISPGVRYSGGKNWNTALSFGVPIVDNLNGYQTQSDYRIVYRFVVAF